MTNWTNKTGSAIAIIGVCIILIYAFGCQPKTTSLIEPGKQVNRTELLTELEILKLKFEDRAADLDKQDEIRNIILQQSLTIANTGDINPLGIITSALAIFGAGASVDNVRLRKKVKRDIQSKGANEA